MVLKNTRKRIGLSPFKANGAVKSAEIAPDLARVQTRIEGKNWIAFKRKARCKRTYGNKWGGAYALRMGEKKGKRTHFGRKKRPACKKAELALELKTRRNGKGGTTYWT